MTRPPQGLASPGRDLQVLEDCTVSLNHRTPRFSPVGSLGGAPGENWLVPAGDESRAERLPDKCTIHAKAGDVVRMLTPGGDGWRALSNA
jgi:5-oxoprolinase (ATP-hydrolysing)